MTVGDTFMIDEDFCFFPVVYKAEELEEVVDIIGRVRGRVAGPFAVPFFLVGWVSPGQVDGFFIMGGSFIAELDCDLEFICPVFRMKDGIQFGLHGFVGASLFPFIHELSPQL